MRLIHTETMIIGEYFDGSIPAYAILSHRWNESEVTYQELRDGQGPGKPGWWKIQGSCEKASADGWEYMWIDSCCIDKASSSELSESINSMFSWYNKAHVCYAYLEDVPGFSQAPNIYQQSVHSVLSQSQWFTRGWTLQELLAPEWVIFLAKDWSELGTKSSLADEIVLITGITHLFNFEEASVAQKMSWAAPRQTTRPEDGAYCMLGIFDVNMPLLYGEGKKAFTRLQLEILNKSDDESIFAWTNPRPDASPRPGLLAEDATCFRDCGQIRRGNFDPARPPHFMTNKGLQMQLLLQPLKASNDVPLEAQDAYLAPLNCTIEDDSGSLCYVVLFLLREEGSFFRYGDPFVDQTVERWASLSGEDSKIMKRTLLHIKQSGHNDSKISGSRLERASYTVVFDLNPLYECGYCLADRIIWPQNAGSWNFWRDNLPIPGQLAVIITSSKCLSMLRFQHLASETEFTIIVGYTTRRPWIMATNEVSKSLEILASVWGSGTFRPKDRADPKSSQDRFEIEAYDGLHIEGRLYRAGVRYPSDKDKFLVKVHPKKRHLEDLAMSNDLEKSCS